jgi:hypothetical protein
MPIRIARLRREQGLNLTCSRGQVAQRLIARMRGEIFDRAGRGLPCMRRQKISNPFFYQLFRAGRFQQAGHIVRQLACL